ncbi:uncharacterized protein B0H18DRAFT_1130155 [Fomitopsis serialis]|uniref:uncharacterized protein n=1 Tax=Fomitopsis serialis TaxID=139415 RepID=UPI0020074B85|nr:uncharacterized protein B0H18DRAFT_1130155 [Neoantrodia serialis]KAH9910428.1 hypothetical protein B0H18DRAFT_1130155 [Neoantrodia serialis]
MVILSSSIRRSLCLEGNNTDDTVPSSESLSSSQLKHPARIKLPKHPTVPLQSIARVEEHHHAPGFSDAVGQYIYTLKLGRPLTSAELKTAMSNMPFDRVDVFHGIKYSPEPLTDAKEETDAVKARPSSGDQPGRFDTVVVLQDADAEATGLQDNLASGRSLLIPFLSYPSHSCAIIFAQGGSSVFSSDLKPTIRGSANTQPSRAIDESHNEPTSPEPSEKMVQNVANTERRGCGEDTKGEEVKKYRVRGEIEPGGSGIEGTYLTAHPLPSLRHPSAHPSPHAPSTGSLTHPSPHPPVRFLIRSPTYWYHNRRPPTHPLAPTRTSETAPTMYPSARLIVLTVSLHTPTLAVSFTNLQASENPISILAAHCWSSLRMFYTWVATRRGNTKLDLDHTDVGGSKLGLDGGGDGLDELSASEGTYIFTFSPRPPRVAARPLSALI